MICLDPVGIVHSPYKETGDAPHQGRKSDTVSVIEIYPRFIPGLGTMKGIHTIWVIYWMDRASRNLLSVRRSDWTEPRPVFTIRSPARPNPIALSIGEIMDIHEGMITVKGIEALDGSPVIDIKPYIRELDCVQDKKD
jgi:tRNA-Thr(GGU) m(6)t(6)A37 methyltransferase TsaA